LSSALKVVMLLIPLQEAFTSNLFEETVNSKIPAAVVARNLPYKIWQQYFTVTRFYNLNLKFTEINHI